MNSQVILERLYGVRIRRRRRRPNAIVRLIHAIRNANGELAAWTERYNWHLVGASLIFGFWVASHAFYYNELTILEFGVKAAWAQVEAGQQKRNHVQRALAALMRYHAGYEKGTLNQVTGLRTGDEGSAKAPAKAPGPDAALSDASPMQLLGELKAIAEQYPNLQLGATVKHFSETVVATESEIAERIMIYNDAVNAYTTMTQSFPGIIFAPVLGFEDYDFYKPEDPSILDYKELQL